MKYISDASQGWGMELRAMTLFLVLATFWGIIIISRWNRPVRSPFTAEELQARERARNKFAFVAGSCFVIIWAIGMGYLLADSLIWLAAMLIALAVGVASCLLESRRMRRDEDRMQRRLEETAARDAEDEDASRFYFPHRGK